MPPYHYSDINPQPWKLQRRVLLTGIVASVPALSLEVIELWPPSNRTRLSAGGLACGR